MEQQEQAEMVKVIADFLELGHVENIMAMFKQDVSYYELTGELIQDERYVVRMGMAVLFEELSVIRPDDLKLAIPHLVPLLNNPTPFIRGEAATLLGIIGTKEALGIIAPLKDDPDFQVREIVSDILAGKGFVQSQSSAT